MLVVTCRGSSSIYWSTISPLHHSWPKHLLPTCVLLQEEKIGSTCQLCGTLFFSHPFSLSLKDSCLRELSLPLFHSLSACSDCLHKSLLRSNCTTYRWRDGPSPGATMQKSRGASSYQSITPLPDIWLLHAQNSSSNWQRWSICFLSIFYTLLQWMHNEGMV